MTSDEASRRSRWVVPAQTIEGMACPGSVTFISEGFDKHLARASGVPGNRVRRAAGVPAAGDADADISTRPHLTVSRRKEWTAAGGAPQSPDSERIQRRIDATASASCA